MKVLVIGSGGREHALVRAIGASSLVSTVYVWPGNDGIFLDGERVPSNVHSADELGLWACRENIELVVIGPESELVAGLSNTLRFRGLNVFGPSQEAARLEASKIYAKDFMRQYSVPTARAHTVQTVAQALEAATEFEAPYVLKADGLAAGKGVYICDDKHALRVAATELFEIQKLGSAGHQALLEEFQPGEEISVLVLTNGKDFQILPYGRDHKRLLDADKGPNTGGMGVVAPVQISQKVQDEIRDEVVKPTVEGLKARGYLYRGVMFIGVMLTSTGPKVLEYNVRFGDPETQALLPLLDGDWAMILKQISEGTVPEMKWRNAATACVVLAAEGYPDSPVRGVVIDGDLNGDMIIHAGTAFREGHFVTNGGRVLNVVASAPTVTQAMDKAYAQVNEIFWAGMQYRKDIGYSLRES
jgi:phosphoribosylamine---glycine ligase